MMMKVVNANPGMGNPMTEEETKNFLANNDKNELLEFIDEKKEPNLIPTGYYFDDQPSATHNATQQPNGPFVRN
jgi:hypothetical protein